MTKATAPDHSARARLDAAFAAEERRGLMLASGGRSAAAFVVVTWLAVVNPNQGAAWAWIVGYFFVVLMQMAFSFRPRLLLLAGDIGSERSMAFATVGDTTNVTSRLQSLTRDLDATIVVSEALVQAVRREGADLAVLDGLKPQGPHVLRGRETPIDLWTA